MNDKTIKKIIRIFVVIFITVLIATIIALIILRYNVEGENNMPFELSKIMVMSMAEGINTSEDAKLEGDLVQNNNIYIEISKNKNYKDTEIIDKIIINNLKVEKAPKTGTVKMYRPIDNNEKLMYENIEENEIKESIEYIGKEKSNVKNLEIANQGGVILFRYAIEDLGRYESKDKEIIHDGTILSLKNIEYQDLQCKVCFDLSIKLKSDITYTGTVSLDLPAGNILEEGMSHYERKDLKDIIFRRNLKEKY